MFSPDTKPHYIIKFVRATDIPWISEGKIKADAYIKAYLSSYLPFIDQQGRKHVKLQRISDIITTPLRKESDNVVWNCYRDFKIKPHHDSLLHIELFHSSGDSKKPDSLLGKIELPISQLIDEKEKTIEFINFKSNKQKNPNFMLTLQRVFSNGSPPKRKIFFLIRHGESKWNEAQAKVNITGLLDCDHALTEEGIDQAHQLNQRWKFAQLDYHSHSIQRVPYKNSPPPPPSAFATENLLDLDGFDEPQPPQTNADPFVSNIWQDDAPWDQDITAKTIDDFTNSFVGDFENPRMNIYEVDDDMLLTNPNDLSRTQQAAFLSINTSQQENPDELITAFHGTKINLTEETTGKVKEEAIDDRREQYTKLFLHADKVYSSPLTRAIETALLSMEGHPALLSHGLILFSVIREIKRIGGLDTVGIATGDAIEKRVRSEVTMVLGAKRADELVSIPFDINDTNNPWWTDMASYDSEKEQQERVQEFLTFSRFCESKIPVFVGHSLFFKAFYSRRISDELLKNRKHLSEHLKKFRLSNASMMAVTVAYLDKENGMSDAVIIDADLIFGGGFHGSLTIDEINAKSINTESIKHSTSSASLSTKYTEKAKEFASFGAELSNEIKANIQKDLKTTKDAFSKSMKKLSDKFYDFLDK